MQAQDFDSLEQVLTEDLAKQSKIVLQSLAPQTTSPVYFTSTAQKTATELNIQLMDVKWGRSPSPAYLGVTLDTIPSLEKQPALWVCSTVEYCAPVWSRQWYGSPKQTPCVRSHPAGPWVQPPKETVVTLNRFRTRHHQPSQTGQQPKPTVCLWIGTSNGTHSPQTKKRARYPPYSRTWGSLLPWEFCIR